MRYFLFILLLCMATAYGKAQSLDQSVDKLYFGLLSAHPDISVREFLEQYEPAMLIKPAPGSGNWQAYPPDTLPGSKCMTVRNVYVFKQHPYFHAPFTSGELGITKRIYTDRQWPDQVTGMQLCFLFDNRTDALKAFQQLADRFSSFHTLKKMNDQLDMKQVAFTDTHSDKFYAHVQVSLVKDYTAVKQLMQVKGNAAATVTKAGYKIIVEPENTLY